MKKAVLFDMDGTLVDSSEGVTRSVQYALKNFGIEEQEIKRLYPFIGPPLKYSFMKYYGFDEEQALDAIEVYRERYNATGIYECRLYPGVEDCLHTLRAQGYLISMASSKPEAMCIRILEHFGILGLFDDTVAATLDGSICTKEEVLREVMRRHADIPPEAMCLVGDTLFDVEGARHVGISCIAVSFGFGDAEEMIRAGAVAACSDMRELPAVIAGL